MEDLINSIQNKMLGLVSYAAPRQVVSAIHNASQESGVDFAYLLQQAGAESSFRADAKAASSSASGLFQFIESTWMNMVERYGEELGIDTDQSREDLLALRDDAQISSHMAAQFAGENARYLERNWGGDVGATELYFAHFLGAGQASAFLKAHDEQPLANAAALFPKAAAANKGVFYDRASGQAKSLAQVYAHFDQKFALESDDLLPNEPAAPSLAQLAQGINNAAPIDQDNAFNQRREHNHSATILSSAADLIYNPLDLILLTQSQMHLSLFEDKNSDNSYL